MTDNSKARRRKDPSRQSHTQESKQLVRIMTRRMLDSFGKMIETVEPHAADTAELDEAFGRIKSAAHDFHQIFDRHLDEIEIINNTQRGLRK